MSFDANYLVDQQNAFAVNHMTTGYVENDNDPEGLYRVQVRIPEHHGDSSRTPIDDLPWALVRREGGGLHDIGNCENPPVGATVLVQFLHGNKDEPIVMGSIIGKPIDRQEGLSKEGKPNGPQDSPDPTRTFRTPKDMTDAPMDMYNRKTDKVGKSTRRVVTKSVKGHTIYMEDADGEELLRIIDRSGQVFEMYCPTSVLSNTGNYEQRGTRNSVQGDQLLNEAMKSGRAHIRMVDLLGQEILVDGNAADPRIRLINRNRANTKRQVIEMSVKDGQEFVSMKDSSGTEFRLTPTEDGSFKLVDNVGSEISAARKTGISIKSPRGSDTNLQGDKTSNVEGDVTSTVGGSSTTRVAGADKYSVVGDAIRSVLGNLSKVVGGAVSMRVSNTPLGGGAPQEFALDIGTVVGGIALQVLGLTGDVLLKTNAPAGSIKLETPVAQLNLGVAGLSIKIGAFEMSVDAAGAAATLKTGASEIQMTTAGILRLQGGSVPCNSLPACLFTGAPHGTTKVLVPPPGT